MDEFMDFQRIPKHLQETIKLAGIFCMADLLELDEELIDDIEHQVREGGFESQVNLDSRQAKMKYFGVDSINLESFTFRPLDRKKLLKLPAAAKLKLDDSTPAKPRKREENFEPQDEEDDDYLEIKPTKKKRKSKNDVGTQATRSARIVQKIIREANAVMAATGYDGRVDDNNVHISLGQNGVFTATVQCKLCNPKKDIILISTKYTATIANFKRHFLRVHYKNGYFSCSKHPEQPSTAVSIAKANLRPDGDSEFVNFKCQFGCDHCLKRGNQIDDDALQSDENLEEISQVPTRLTRKRKKIRRNHSSFNFDDEKIFVKDKLKGIAAKIIDDFIDDMPGCQTHTQFLEIIQRRAYEIGLKINVEIVEKSRRDHSELNAEDESDTEDVLSTKKLRTEDSRIKEEVEESANEDEDDGAEDSENDDEEGIDLHQKIS